MAGFNTAVTGIKATTTALDVAGNNIANASTVGFKATRAEFADLYATQVVGAGSANIAGSGVLVSDLAQDFSSGTTEFTNSNLDLAINGSGFFQLNDGNGGLSYTRAGAFELDKDGFIVSKNGKHLRGYGLDAQGNQLPITNLQVKEKESPPHPTENIALSVNMQPAEDITKKEPYYDKANASSYAYTTTIETYDSLGNTQAIKFNYVEQQPLREYHQYDITSGGLVAANNTAPVNSGSTAGFKNLTAEEDVLSISGVALSWQIDTDNSRAESAAADEIVAQAANYGITVAHSDALAAVRGAATAGTIAATDLNPVGGVDLQAALEAASLGSAALVGTAATAAYASGATYVLTSAAADALQAADPRIDVTTVRYQVYHDGTGLLSSSGQPAQLDYKLKSEASGQGDVVVSLGTDSNPADGEDAPTLLSISNVDNQGRPALQETNESVTVTLFGDGAGPFTAGTNSNALGSDITIQLGGVDITIPKDSTADVAGKLIVDQYERELKNNDPDIDSVTYDEATNKLKITWKAEAGDVYSGGTPYLINGGGTTPATSIFSLSGTAPAVTTVEGDNSYLGTYRLYAYLNDEELLNIGKSIDPGESNSPPAVQNAAAGTGYSEPGPVMIKFSSKTGLIESINGQEVRDQGSVPALTIRGADQANPNDDLPNDPTDDLDGLRGVQLDLSGSTRWESASIVKDQSQDGYSKGDLIGVSFDERGRMVAAYSNGQQQNIGIVALATFENQAGLQPAGDTEWVPTLDSGQARLNPPGTGLNGSIRSGALEQSNVDLSAELVKLIEYQRNYQANSKTLETLNTVTQSILQI